MGDKKDDFWDIAALLPKKKGPPPPPYGEILPPLVQEAPAAHTERPKSEALTLHLDWNREAEKLRTYEPKDNPLLTHVCVLSKRSHTHLFHGFRAEGAAWLAERGTACAYVPYFSFVPQYNQLNLLQKAYYLYFRDEANAGNYLDAGQSYVLLYIYEIINLPEYIPPKIGILRLANAWAAYRDKLPALDRFMICWLADYALLHGLSCPRAILLPFLQDILQKAPLKEFYLGISGEGEETLTDALLLLSASYKYQNSRYAQGEHKELFMTHIRGAASAVLHRLFREGAEKPRYQTVKKRYEVFAGALWAGARRYELEVSYFSVTGTEDLRILLTAAVKYAENKIRAYLAVKSRLTVNCLPDAYRALIDAYFDASLPIKDKRSAQNEPRPTYEALYDAPSAGVSFKEAAEIEEHSWENTWRLIPDEERREILSLEKEKTSAATHPSAGKSEGDRHEGESGEASSLLRAEERAFLALLLDGKEEEARALSRRCGVSYLTLGERINEAFSDLLGDIVLELSSDRYLPIADYESEIRDAISG